MSNPASALVPEVEEKEPPNPMQMAMQIFAKIAGTSPAIVTEQGTALKPEDVTRALIERGFGMTKIMDAQLKIKQIVKNAGDHSFVPSLTSGPTSHPTNHPSFHPSPHHVFSLPPIPSPSRLHLS
jgi:hypothetical protein